MDRLESLEPTFRTKVEQLMARMKELTALDWVVVQGRRTMAEQNALYAQGRTTAGKIVTNARGGDSPHNFGEGADLVAKKVDGKLWWDAEPIVWKTLADEARKLGLVAGYYFKNIHDNDHVESADWRKRREQWRAGTLQVP